MTAGLHTLPAIHQTDLARTAGLLLATLTPLLAQHGLLRAGGAGGQGGSRRRCGRRRGRCGLYTLQFIKFTKEGFPVDSVS